MASSCFSILIDFNINWHVEICVLKCTYPFEMFCSINKVSQCYGKIIILQTCAHLVVTNLADDKLHIAHDIWRRLLSLDK